MAYDIFTLGVPDEWPLRLLHIPSMTSIERRDGDMYREDHQPRYAIISYTWGRYELPDGPRIQIFGIDWPIPAIDPKHFTVGDLTHLLNRIGQNYDYIWIDIACIDQKRHALKMKEIGRQASIFKCASQAYVWLNSHQVDVLAESMQKLLQCGWDASNDEDKDAAQVAEEMSGALSVILQDRWFSSLWTLQESILQRHSLFLNKRGGPVETHGPWTGESLWTQVLDLSGACKMVRDFLDRAIVTFHGSDGPSDSNDYLHKLQQLRTAIDHSGIDFELCPNPNIAYAAARFRQTTRAEDRIYAIMQVYGYQLGESAPSSAQSSEGFALVDLELQFLQALNAQSCLISQAFQHLHVPQQGQSWAFTNAIRVPQRLHTIIAQEQFVSSGSYVVNIVQRAEAYFIAKSWSFKFVLGFLHQRAQGFIAQLEERVDVPLDLKGRAAFFDRSRILKVAKQGIIADASDQYDCESISIEWPLDTTAYNDRNEPLIECRTPELHTAALKLQGIGARLIGVFGEDKVRVLYLGRTKYIETMELGLIVVREKQTTGKFLRWKKHVWRRIGLCFWHWDRYDDVGDLEANLAPMKGRFG
ncbi:uncharacterized protein KY384_006228 [Bacidia gigantensis]|uniref:uncharacterized protein n=1 Tax=Bacidia gigantensis TaxID=2732470 RepID=UPI001D05546D|nr:uncharacterized protein KY384_006228 [Bacidia gigantensis]KAG8529591.1 hypothetical protein KY384_006228 [Bacidia gigantensis]